MVQEICSGQSFALEIGLLQVLYFYEKLNFLFAQK
jgi:hypothetical protein